MLDTSSAQDGGSVKGQVFDAENRLPVSGVNVIVRGLKVGTTTDSLGFFRISVPPGENYILVFSHIAYEKLTRHLSLGKGKEVEYRLALSPTAIGMEEVVILGERPFVVTKYAEQTAIRKLDGTDFEKLGEERMERALAYLLPGVVRPLRDRMAMTQKGRGFVMDGNDFTLYVNGEWKESITLDDIDPFSVTRVLVWDANPFITGGNADLAPVAFSVRRGNRYVVLIQTK